MGKSAEKEIERLEKLAALMDSRFGVPGTSLRFGLDPLLGLIPVVGDTVTAAATAYLIGKAQAFELPWYITLQMVWNAFLDWLIGLIPLAGDIFDLGWKANNKNVELLKKAVADKKGAHRDIQAV